MYEKTPPGGSCKCLIPKQLFFSSFYPLSPFVPFSLSFWGQSPLISFLNVSFEITRTFFSFKLAMKILNTFFFTMFFHINFSFGWLWHSGRAHASPRDVVGSNPTECSLDKSHDTKLSFLCSAKCLGKKSNIFD